MGGLGGGEGGPYVELVLPTVGQVVALVTTPAAFTTTTRLYVRHASRPLGTTAVGSRKAQEEISVARASPNDGASAAVLEYGELGARVPARVTLRA